MNTQWVSTLIRRRESASGASRRTPMSARRGTVLLMVLGVLALMAIIAVAYATLGRADRAESGSMVRKQRIEDQSTRIADYLAQTIADGTFATYVEPAYVAVPYVTRKELSNPQIFILRQKAFDYPLTDSTMVSVPSIPAVAGQTAFDPTGSYDTAWTGADPDPREQGTPFLAGSEPTFVGWIRPTGALSFGLNQPWYALAHSWTNISNFAPSGNFVNLKNLRNNFDAAPGFKTDTAGKGRMSYGLTLFQERGEQEFAQSDPGLGGTAKVPDLAGNFADPMKPAHWSALQYRMFRPIADRVNQPEDFKFLGNQYADADGDGMIDSRWFELKKIKEMDTTGTPGGAKSLLDLLPTAGRVRYFVAARAIDSTGLVNVNTATDEWRTDDVSATSPLVDAAPGFDKIDQAGFNLDDYHPIGSTPAEIDLRRLLTLEDVKREYGGGTFTSKLLEALPQPSNPSTNATGNFTKYDATSATKVGRAGYLSLRRSIVNDRNIEASGTAVPESEQAAASASSFGSSPMYSINRQSFYDELGFSTAEGRALTGATPALSLGSPFDLGDELDLRAFAGVNDDRTLSRLEAVLGGRAPITPTVSVQDPALRSFGPLRETRPRSLELSFRDQPLVLNGTNAENVIVDTSRIGVGANTMPNERALFSMASDIRRLLTTFNGARPLVDSVVAGDNLGTGLPTSAVTPTVRVRTDVSSSLRTLRTPTDPVKVARAVNVLFGLYADALMPYADQQSKAWKWPPDSDSSGLSYGGSAELAMRMSAHLAVNAAEMVPKDDVPGKLKGLRGQPVALTLDVTRAAATDPDSTAQVAGTYPWPRLRLEERSKGDTSTNKVYPRHFGSGGNLANAAGDFDRVNVYGVAPHPFLTEVAVLAMYTDTPSGAPVTGDVEPPGPPVAGVPQPGPVTIKFDAELSNPDYLGELIAFQLHNPFDEAITLYETGVASTASPRSARARFYLEYAGRRYLLARQKENSFDVETTTTTNTPVSNDVLAPGETITVYALNPGTRQELLDRINNAYKAGPKTLSGASPSDLPMGDLLQFIDNELKPLGAQKRAYQIPQVPSDSFAFDPSVYPKTVPFVGATTMHEVDLWGTTPLPGTGTNADDVGTAMITSDPGQRQVASLWRVMRDSVTGDVTGDNNPSNDLLVDRLRDPQPSGSTASLLFDTRQAWVAKGNQDVTGTQAPPDSSRDLSLIIDNTGYSMIAWARMGRPTDKGKTVGQGVLPAWCLEAKIDNAVTVATSGSARWSMNVSKPFDTSKVPGNKSDFTGSSNDKFPTLDDMVKTSSTAVKQMALLAINRDDPKSEIAGTSYTSGTTGRTYTEAAIEYIAAARLPGSTPGEYLTSSLFTRPGDFLLPLCVGPEQYPNRATTGKRSSDLEASWLTTSEALALSADFYSPPAGDINEALGRSDLSTSPPAIPKTDRGRLVLDKWTPYYTYLSANPDQWRAIGSGVPFALCVMDNFRAGLGVSRSIAGAKRYRDTAYGSSLQNVSGLLNLNTAPLTNLRTVPLLSPIAGASVTSPSSWLSTVGVTKLGNVGIRNLGWSYTSENNAATPRDDGQLFIPGTHTYDIATTLAAYRDKQPKRSLPLPGGLPGDGTAIDVSDQSVSGTFRQPRAVQFGEPTVGVTPATVREGRGVKSIGEAFLARYRDLGGVLLPDFSMNRYAVLVDGSTPPRPLGIHWPGLLTSTHLQQDSTSGQGIITTSGSAGVPIPAKTPRSYEQQLAILNALGNTATVRSDVFTVYFLVHGYTPEDVQVEDGQDMTPSVRKRFVMIVDRSNVVQKGDKPRIVTLKEVPVE